MSLTTKGFKQIGRLNENTINMFRTPPHILLVTQETSMGPEKHTNKDLPIGRKVGMLTY